MKYICKFRCWYHYIEGHVIITVKGKSVEECERKFHRIKNHYDKTSNYNLEYWNWEEITEVN